MKQLYKLLFLVYMISSLVKADADLEKQIADMQDQIDALAEAVEEGGSSGEAGWWTKTSLGGYGEFIGLIVLLLLILELLRHYFTRLTK